MPFLLLIMVFVCSLITTGYVRRFALKSKVLDLPNQRSSHTVATPRGGGLAFVLCFSVFGLLSMWLSGMFATSYAVFVGSCVMVAIIGWFDDKGHVASGYRLLIHFIAAVLIVLAIGHVERLILFAEPVHLGVMGFLLCIITLVWILNLYNFMDGINGIAGIEAVFLSAAMACLMYFQANAYWLVEVWLILGAAVAGFVVWNFPKAKIFMGDVGSGFLGIAIGGLILISAHHNAVFLWSGLILLGVFIVDSTFTLFRRALAGKKLYEAHSTHAYQHAARRCKSHVKVTLGVLIINVFWLLPIAAAVSFGYVDGMIGLIVAYSPLVLSVIVLKAGQSVEPC